MKDGVQDAYRKCFFASAGQATLGQMLVDAGYFDTNMKTTEELAVLNYVKTILKNCGLHNKDTVKSYVQKLFEIPVTGAK